MSSHLDIQPDPRFLELQSGLVDRLARVADSIRPSNLASLLDPLMRDLLEVAFQEAGAHEGTIWWHDESNECLVPGYNTGPNAAQLVGKFRQPLNAGLVCMVLASEQPFLENRVYQNAQQSKLLDMTLGVRSYALIAVPFYLLRGCRGVVSCVQLLRPEEPEPAGFQPRDLAGVQRAVSCVSRLLEWRLVGQTLGWPVD